MNRFLSDERGANVVEYAIIVGFILLAVIVVLALIGADTNAMIDDPALQSSLS